MSTSHEPATSRRTPLRGLLAAMVFLTCFGAVFFGSGAWVWASAHGADRVEVAGTVVDVGRARDEVIVAVRYTEPGTGQSREVLSQKKQNSGSVPAAGDPETVSVVPGDPGSAQIAGERDVIAIIFLVVGAGLFLLGGFGLLSVIRQRRRESDSSS